MNVDSANVPDELVPLTVGQRYRLIMLIVPCFSLLAMVVLFVTFWVPIVGPPQPLFYPFMAVALAFTGYDAVRAFQDLQSGTAIATEDTIRRTWIGRQPSFLRAHGRLERLGHVRMTSRARLDAASGLRHRVVISPASKIVWSAEPLGSLKNLGL